MSDTADTVTLQPRNAGGTRASRWLVRRAAGLLAVGVLGVLIQGCSPEPGIDGDDDPPAVSQQESGAAGDDAHRGAQSAADDEHHAGHTADWDELRADLGVTPAEFRARWNDAVAALDAGAPLGAPAEVASAFHGLPTREYPVGDITSAEVVLTPQQDRVVTVRAANITPEGIRQRRDLVALISAAISATTELSPADARGRVTTDLDVTEDTVVEGHQGERIRIDGVTVGAFATQDTWEFFLQRRPE